MAGLLEHVADGGQGRIFRFNNHVTGRIEVMKILRPEFASDPEFVARFESEASILANINHPNIASLICTKRIDRNLAIFLEWVEGQSLEFWMNLGPIPVNTMLGYLDQILGALEYIHSQGIVFRDLKPCNILITPEGRIKLLDFGIARVLAQNPRLTRVGDWLGTPKYMSPEQFAGLDVDARSDLFSLGLILCEALTGQVSLDGDQTGQSELTPALRRIIMRALQKKPEDRFQSAEEFRIALRGNLGIASPSVASVRSKRSWLFLLIGFVTAMTLLPIFTIKKPAFIVPRPIIERNGPVVRKPAQAAVPARLAEQPALTLPAQPKLKSLARKKKIRHKKPALSQNSRFKEWANSHLNPMNPGSRVQASLLTPPTISADPAAALKLPVSAPLESPGEFLKPHHPAFFGKIKNLFRR